MNKGVENHQVRTLSFFSKLPPQEKSWGNWLSKHKRDHRCFPTDQLFSELEAFLKGQRADFVSVTVVIEAGGLWAEHGVLLGIPAPV